MSTISRMTGRVLRSGLPGLIALLLGVALFEFVQGGQVKGREVVTVVPDSDIAQVADGPRPRAGASRVEMLKGNDYLRVWINKGGTNYLIHLPPA